MKRGSLVVSWGFFNTECLNIVVKETYHCILNSDKKENIHILKQEMQASAPLLWII